MANGLEKLKKLCGRGFDEIRRRRERILSAYGEQLGFGGKPIFRDALKFLYLNARHIETYLSTSDSPNTYLTGEAAGLYYLGTLLPEFRRAARWREIGRRILLAELDRQILPDGVYFERTTWYQRYTADFYTHF